MDETDKQEPNEKKTSEMEIIGLDAPAQLQGNNQVMVTPTNYQGPAQMPDANSQPQMYSYAPGAYQQPVNYSYGQPPQFYGQAGYNYGQFQGYANPQPPANVDPPPDYQVQYPVPDASSYNEPYQMSERREEKKGCMGSLAAMCPQFGRTHRDVTDKLMFIRKVYTILVMQLMLTVVIVGIAVGNDDARDAIQTYWPIMVVFLVIALVILCMIFCCSRFAKKHPLNLILLLVFTICMAYVVAWFASFFDPYAVLACGVITFAITLALTIYACAAKEDISQKCGVVLVVCVAMLFFAICLSFTFGQWVSSTIVLVVCIIYGVFIVLDTQRIVGDDRHYKLTYDDYIVGALALYIDIVGLFIMLLALLGNKK